MEMDGVYPVRVIPLGGDVCLSKDRESRFIEDLIVEGETWWKNWFSEIKRWEEGTVGESRDVWLRIFGIPAHVWMSYFFVALAEVWLKFICVDERTAKGKAFDVARIMVKVNLYLKILDVFPVTIDGKMFNLVMREDAIGLFGSNVEPSGNRDSASSSADSERIWQDFSLKGSLNHGVDVPFRDHGEIDKGDSSGGGGGGSENFKGSFSISVLLGREENSATAWKDAKLGSFDEAVSRFRAETSLNFDSNNISGSAIGVGSVSLKSAGEGNKFCCNGGRILKKSNNSSKGQSRKGEHNGEQRGTLLLNFTAGSGSLEGSQCSVFYGEHIKESDIVRNNGRQWKYLENDFGGNLWDAIAALGVVDVEGCGKKICLSQGIEEGDCENREGQKELTNGDS
ncbi:uncharacterized protein LOC131619486 [Vicia villosa]|uniref:uncharacterized protein LOC131619486 n=1 Tax=Vicia villosa TaxID=3911 RepID=UPI00273C1B9E|nr:uncharacterized protein LOC131619486 [Vicia villosa]